MRIARGAAAMVLGGALAIGAAVTGPPGTATAAPPGRAPGVVSWSPALDDGDAVGVQVVAGGVRLTPDRAVAADAALSPDGHGDVRAPGLLTLPARTLDAPAGRVEATVDVTAGAASSAVTVDVRGLQAGGVWSEWLPAEPSSRGAATASRRTVQVVLPGPATQVQARLVLTPVRTRGWGTARGPEVHGLTLTAYPAAPSARSQARRDPQRYRVFATREGLVGGTTANGHVVTKRDIFVALPSRRSLSPRNTSDYSVKVCAPTGRCAFAPVWDVGPWNTRDDYWNPSNRRQTWGDLPRGVPEAQAAKTQGYNGGKDQFGRVVKNPAGIDLGDGMFWDALGLRDNAWVTVDYLWTGDSPMATVRVNGRVNLRNAPRTGAPVIGLAANGAAVPVQCVSGAWLRIAAGQFLPASSVPRAQWSGRLPACG
jgi:hypothetical protein